MLVLASTLPLRATAQAPRSGSAQAPASPAVGDRVRFSRQGGTRRTGRLIARTGDSIVVEFAGRHREEIPVFEVGALEVSGGRRRHLIGGTVGGVVIGAGVGLLLRNIRQQDLGYDAFGSKPRKYANLFPISIAGGTAMGALVGAMGTERWTPASVSASETRVGIAIPGRRAGIGLVVSGRW